jgi:hypothetical protein
MFFYYKRKPVGYCTKFLSFFFQSSEWHGRILSDEKGNVKKDAFVAYSMRQFQLRNQQEVFDCLPSSSSNHESLKFESDFLHRRPHLLADTVIWLGQIVRSLCDVPLHKQDVYVLIWVSWPASQKRHSTASSHQWCPNFGKFVRYSVLFPVTYVHTFQWKTQLAVRMLLLSCSVCCMKCLLSL